jgi:hypothetical protein
MKMGKPSRKKKKSPFKVIYEVGGRRHFKVGEWHCGRLLGMKTRNGEMLQQRKEETKGNRRFLTWRDGMGKDKRERMEVKRTL